MKKSLILILLIALILSSSVKAQDRNLITTFGYKEDFNISSELLKYGSVGFGVGFIFNSDYSKSQVREWEVPHNNYDVLGDKNMGTTYGVDLSLPIEVNDSPLIIKPGVGLYWTEVWEIARSNATGYLYKQSSSNDFNIDANISVLLNPSEKVTFGLGYSRLRGINGSLGFGF